MWTTKRPQLFLDLDGVLADFDTGYEKAFGVRPVKTEDNVNWQRISDKAAFYRDIPAMPDAYLLWNFCRSYFNPIILTGIPKSVSEAAENKREWVRNHFGPVPVITCRSCEKSDYMYPGDIIVDDWDKYQPVWVAKGGTWILHTSAIDSIVQLEALI